MKTHTLKRYLINAGISVYLLATPVAVLIWFKDNYSLLPEFINQSIENGIMFLATPVVLLSSSIFFIVKSEYVILTFLLYTIISTVFITLVKTIHIFHYLQSAMVFLPLLYLSVEWKQSGEMVLLPDKSTEK